MNKIVANEEKTKMLDKYIEQEVSDLRKESIDNAKNAVLNEGNIVLFDGYRFNSSNRPIHATIVNTNGDYAYDYHDAKKKLESCLDKSIRINNLDCYEEKSKYNFTLGDSKDKNNAHVTIIKAEFHIEKNFLNSADKDAFEKFFEKSIDFLFLKDELEKKINIKEKTFKLDPSNCSIYIPGQ